jgi:hypothetical protein
MEDNIEHRYFWEEPVIETLPASSNTKQFGELHKRLTETISRICLVAHLLTKPKEN